MPKSYSVDLRERVLQYLEKNKNREAASRLFQVVYLLFIDGFLVEKKRVTLSLCVDLMLIKK